MSATGNQAPPVPFIDLRTQWLRLKEGIENRLDTVLNRCAFIMGPEVDELEQALAQFCGCRHVVTCANGTDALLLGLMVRRVQPGHAVFVPSFTFAATAEVVCLAGATPVFVDVDPVTFNMDPSSLERAIARAIAEGLKPQGVIAVDLFGQPADYDSIAAVAEAKDLWLIDDAAQSFGATYRGRPVGTLAPMTATSFFPAKPLGCYGDGGAVFTDDDAAVELLRSLRIHGQGGDKYTNVRVGLNSRLDTMQAAILLEKLSVFHDEIARRQRVADAYCAGLNAVVTVPRVLEGQTSTWAQYTLRVPADRRADLADRLREQNIPTAMYYPTPLHRQQAYERFPAAEPSLPVSEALAAEVISLPMHPYLDDATQGRIIEAVYSAMK